MKTDKLLVGAVAVVGGIIVGKNWDKIKNFAKVSLTRIKRETQLVYEKSAKGNKSVKNKIVSISCPQCQTELKSTALFCYKCGRKQ